MIVLIWYGDKVPEVSWLGWDPVECHKPRSPELRKLMMGEYSGLRSINPTKTPRAPYYDLLSHRRSSASLKGDRRDAANSIERRVNQSQLAVDWRHTEPHPQHLFFHEQAKDNVPFLSSLSMATGS
eukprot:g28079.t1